MEDYTNKERFVFKGNIEGTLFNDFYEKQQKILEIAKPYIVQPSEIDPKVPELMIFAENILSEYFKNLGFENVKKLPVYFLNFNSRNTTKEKKKILQSLYLTEGYGSGVAMPFFGFSTLDLNELKKHKNDLNILITLQTYAHELYHTTSMVLLEKVSKMFGKNEISPTYSLEKDSLKNYIFQNKIPTLPNVIEEGSAVEFERLASEHILKKFNFDYEAKEKYKNLERYYNIRLRNKNKRTTFTEIDYSFGDIDYSIANQIHKILCENIPNYLKLLENLRLNQDITLYKEIFSLFGENLGRQILSDNLDEIEKIYLKIKKFVEIKNKNL